MRIGIDLMGGDSPPHLLFPAVIEASKQFSDEHCLIVIATKKVVDAISVSFSAKSTSPGAARIEFCVAEDSIEMEENPLEAIRRKKGSSLVVGIRLLKKKQLDAFVSCGNTGALIASAAITLPLLPGVSRPALLVLLPTKKGPVAILDVGGNVSCKAQHLVRFAFLGSAYQRAVQGIEVPAVGLLNVGTESKKGTVEVREAYELLQSYCQDLAAQGIAPRMHFLGNVEGRQVFDGEINVLVTDGFTGNVLLKTAEGVSAFIFDALEDFQQENTSAAFQGTFLDLKKQFNYSEYPGAVICGIDGVVVKVHGNATAETLLKSILGAASCVQNKVITLIKDQLQ